MSANVWLVWRRQWGGPECLPFVDEQAAFAAVRHRYPGAVQGDWVPLGLVPGLLQVIASGLPEGASPSEFCSVFAHYHGAGVAYLVRARPQEGAPSPSCPRP
jgi:hypothetical protein